MVESLEVKCIWGQGRNPGRTLLPNSVLCGVQQSLGNVDFAHVCMLCTGMCVLAQHTLAWQPGCSLAHVGLLSKDRHPLSWCSRAAPIKSSSSRTA